MLFGSDLYDVFLLTDALSQKIHFLCMHIILLIQIELVFDVCSIYGSPSLTNPGNPGSVFPTSYGPDSPPTGSSFPAGSPSLRPHISLIILVLLFFTGELLLGT